MDEQGIKKAFILMGTLWSNYKPPQDPKEIKATLETWLGFFRNIPEEEVHSTIMKMAAEGREFSPNVGQIYAAIKSHREKIKELPARTENAATRLRDYRKPIDEAYRSKGLYPYHEAGEHGISSGEWERMVKA